MVAEYTTVLICPWWELNESMTVGHFTFEPIGSAIERYPALAVALREHARPFCTGYMYPKQEDNDAYQRGLDVPLYPQATRPTVVVLEDVGAIEEVRATIDKITFACLSAMEAGGIYTNSAVFESRVLRLVSPATEFTVGENRRMTGRSHNLYSIRNRIETKPDWCGQFQRPDSDLLDGLLKIPSARAKAFESALAALRHATLDVGYVPADTERAFYALVVTNVLLDIATADTEKAHISTLRKLLNPKVPGGAGNILDVYRSMRLHRNAKWHPKPRARPDYLFERQSIVPLSLLYFRVVESVIIARLVDLGCVEKDAKLAAKITAINKWIGDINGLVGQDFEQPKTKAELTLQKERFEAAASVSKHWSKAHMVAVTARVRSEASTP